MNLPRQLNEGEHVMAASPSHVMARVMKNSGFGKDAVILLACVFLGLAMLMLLSVLASGLAQRRYDLAVLRVLGASPILLASTVLYEGLILSALGCVAGVAFGHVIAFGIASAVPALQTLLIPSHLLLPVVTDITFILSGIACGVAASLIPCASAARTDIAGVLAQGR
jgi:putative ABC transport system permease protein